MYKDPTEFRARFKAYKEGKMPYENGLPKFAGGTPGQTPDESFVESMGPLLYRELLYQWVENPDSVYNNLIHQLAYESNRGRSRVAREQHNYGGVGWNGKTYFSYKNDADFVHDYVKLMNHRYKKAIAAPTLSEYAAGIKKLGYFEDSLENYSRNLNGMKSLAKAATKHKQSNPDLYKIDVLRSAPETIVNPMDNTKVITTIPAEQTIPAYDTKVSPYISGKPTIHLQPRIKLPNLLDMLDDEWEPTIGFKNGKLPCFAIGKGDGMKYSWDDQKQEWNRYTGDEYGDVFADFVVTPRGGAHKKDIKPVKIVTPEQEAFVAQNQPIIKLDDDLFLRNRISEESNKRTWRSDVADALHAVGEGAMLASMFAGPEVEPLVYPAYNAAKAAIAGAFRSNTPAMQYLRYPVGKFIYGLDALFPTLYRKIKALPTEPQDGIVQISNPGNRFVFSNTREESPIITNFTYDAPVRRHASGNWDSGYTIAMPGKKVLLGKNVISTEPSDLFTYGDNILVPLKNIKLISGDIDEINAANKYGYDVVTSPKLQLLYEAGDSKGVSFTIDGGKKFNIRKQELSGYAKEVENMTRQLFKSPTKKDVDFMNFVLLPKIKGRVYDPTQLDYLIREGIEPFGDRIGNAQLREYLLDPTRWENILYDPATHAESMFRDEMGITLKRGYKDGKSPIHIKPANRGKLTRLKARTGKSESELYNDGNPAHKKMVVFARSSRKWHKG